MSFFFFGKKDEKVDSAGLHMSTSTDFTSKDDST